MHKAEGASTHSCIDGLAQPSRRGIQARFNLLPAGHGRVFHLVELGLSGSNIALQRGDLLVDLGSGVTGGCTGFLLQVSSSDCMPTALASVFAERRPLQFGIAPKRFLFARCSCDGAQTARSPKRTFAASAPGCFYERLVWIHAHPPLPIALPRSAEGHSSKESKKWHVPRTALESPAQSPAFKATAGTATFHLGLVSWNRETAPWSTSFGAPKARILRACPPRHWPAPQTAATSFCWTSARCVNWQKSSGPARSTDP